MKGKIFIFLFALPFLGIGMWTGFSMFSHAYDAWQMRAWAPVEATIQNAGYQTRSSDDSDTYEAYGEYFYHWNGRRYDGERVSISGGADNIGDYQRELGLRLGNARSRGETVTAWVDPSEPSNSIIDRSMRWGLVGFKAIFFLLFGGFGAGLIFLVFKPGKAVDLPPSILSDKPWLARDAWQAETIRSSSKTVMWFAWGFAAFWNAISSPLPFLIYPEVVEKGNMLALIGIVFPLVGIGLLWWAVRRTLEWRSFGPAPVRLDPFPGAIGGHVGGTIDLNRSFDPHARFSLTLTSLHSYVSGSGDNRSRRESPKWQDSQIAHVTSGPRGTRLTFRFDVPDGLNESDAAQEGDAYDLWRLNLRAELPGTDIDRDYEIPVYATGESSRRLPAFSVDAAKAGQRSIDTDAVRSLVRLGQGTGGNTMLFPVGRNVVSGIAGLLFGAMFAGVGWFLVTREDHWFIGGIFGFVGGIIVLSSIYHAFNSLEVIRDGGTLRTVRRLFGVPVKSGEMRRVDFVRFKKKSSMSSQSGSRHVMYYTLYAIDDSGKKLTVGEGFKGASQAEAAADLIGREFGLTARQGPREERDTVAGYNVLTAD